MVKKYLYRILLFLLLMMAVGRVLPDPESYINDNMATSFCRFLYGDVNCETMYDTLFYIDMFVILLIAMAVYLVLLNIIKRFRRR